MKTTSYEKLREWQGQAIEKYRRARTEERKTEALRCMREIGDRLAEEVRRRVGLRADRV